ncbi:unnamed protein product [Rhizoctonia solani]|uniref:HAT C-terminal dimerisation domain-containing protein n=1 Tax=Rhizoctonia solani TaxID=456999 RepID=A0A8H2XE05_9AGAM|nr:unnamed protein product [Rhizoctonia solani]
MHPNVNVVNSTISSSRPPESVFQDHNSTRNSHPLIFAPLTQGQSNTAAPQDSQKHAATGIPVPPASKRLRGLAASTNPQDLAPLHQIEIARRAAASLPAPYRIEDPSQAEAARRVQAARAIDCWYLTVGDDHETEPSEQVKAELRISDQKRLETTPMDLRKPQTSRIRCTKCLKFGHWKTWKNNHNGGSADHIRGHLVKEHYSAYLAACERINYTPANRHDPIQLDDDVKEPLTPEGIIRYLTDWFAEDDISFNMVSHRGFRRFVNYIGQGKVAAKDLPDWHTIAAKAAALSEEAKERIKKEIKHARGRVSCTTDLWTDDSQRAFMCQVNRLIAFRVIEGTHAGAHLAEMFFEVMEEFGILGWITMDNATNNDSLMGQLEEYMVTQGMDFDRHGNRLRCFPHVVNLAVQDILNTLAVSATEYHNAMSRYIASDPGLAEYAITHADYEVLHDILTVLNFAHRTQELLSSDKVPTLAFAIPLYHALVDQWTRLQSMLPALSGAIVHIVAMALNPSIRYEWFDQNCSPEEALNARVVFKQHMLHCLEEQQKEQSEDIVSPPNSSRDPTETATKRLNTGYSSLLASGVDTRPASRLFPTLTKPGSTSTNSVTTPTSASLSPSTTSTHTTTPSTSRRPATNRALNEATVELEHRKFEEEAVIVPEDMNGLTPIDYWLARSNDLPLVYRVALDVLPAQASSVSSERVFSSSKLTCTQHRNHISASNVEALQILKHSLRSQRDAPYIDTPETLDFMTHHRDEFAGDGAILTVN